jgi:glycosyltransferase involved in cell wall biosynthesis
MKGSITLAISTRESYEFLKRSTEDLINQSDQDFHVIIQDNTPFGETIETLNIPDFAFKDQRFSYIKKECSGLSESRNICVERCKTEYIHFLDDDLSIPSDFVKSVKNVILKNPNACAIGGRVLPDWSFCEKPNWLTRNCLIYLSMLDFGDEQKPFGSSKVPWLVGANLCMKTRKIIEYGLFNTYLGRIGGNQSLLGSEENDLLHRMKGSEEIIYSPEFVVDHYVDPKRLNIDWLIKRASWQAVSDVLSDQHWLGDLPNQEERLINSLSCLKNEDPQNIDELLHSAHFSTYKLLMGEV